MTKHLICLGVMLAASAGLTGCVAPLDGTWEGTTEDCTVQADEGVSTRLVITEGDKDAFSAVLQAAVGVPATADGAAATCSDTPAAAITEDGNQVSFSTTTACDDDTSYDLSLEGLVVHLGTIMEATVTNTTTSASCYIVYERNEE